MKNVIFAVNKNKKIRFLQFLNEEKTVDIEGHPALLPWSLLGQTGIQAFGHFPRRLRIFLVCWLKETRKSEWDRIRVRETDRVREIEKERDTEKVRKKEIHSESVCEREY